MTNYTLYIDESGDDGFNVGRGATEWLIFGGISLHSSREAGLIQALVTAKMALGLPLRKPLHFRGLSEAGKSEVIQVLARSAVSITLLAIYKPAIAFPDTFRKPTQRHGLYLHGVSTLVGQALPHLHQNATERGDLLLPSTRIVFSKRSEVHYEDFFCHLDKLRRQAVLDDRGSTWRLLSDTGHTALTPGRAAGLQLADAAASLLFAALRRDGRQELTHFLQLAESAGKGDLLTSQLNIRIWPAVSGTAEIPAEVRSFLQK